MGQPLPCPAIVADTEVFSKYFLFVAKDLQTEEVFIIETRKGLREFYEKYKSHVWCTYNTDYDKYIIRAVLCGIDPKPINDAIIYGSEPIWRNVYVKNMGNKFPLITYDIKTTDKSLKVLEAFMGEDIKESSVPFDLDRCLTRQEKDEVIMYCRHDVEMAAKVFEIRIDDFLSHWNLVKQFNLPLEDLDKTASRLSLAILGCRRQPVRFDPEKNKYYEVVTSFGSEFDWTPPFSLQLNKYQHIENWFIDQCRRGKAGEYVYNNSLETTVAGCPCVFAWGGGHGALKQYQASGRIVCLDVKSLYPSLMIHCRYFSRNIQHYDRYVNIYHERLKIKHSNPSLSKAYKLVLNSTYGTFKDKYSHAYDPLMANNICIAGQLLLLDLMEKVEAYSGCRLIQYNTDGVYYLVDSDEDYRKLQSIAQEWMDRTKLELEEEIYSRIYQRDVNTYMLIAADGHFKAKGAIKKNSLLDNDIPIINEAIHNYFVHGTPIRDYINNCNELIKFQKVYKLQGKYNYVMHNGKKRNDLKVYRVFASKNNKDTALFKGSCNTPDKVELFAGCPKSCFIDNSKVAGRTCPDNLDKSWYIHQAERLLRTLDAPDLPLLASLL